MEIDICLDWYAADSGFNLVIVWAHAASLLIASTLLLFSGVLTWLVKHWPRENWPSFVVREVESPEGTWVITAAGLVLLIPVFGPIILGMLIFNSIALGLIAIAAKMCEKMGITHPWY